MLRAAYCGHDFFADCLAALDPGDTGIAVLHGACLTVGLLGLLGWPGELSPTLQGMENGGCAVGHAKPGVRRIRLTQA